MVAWNGTDRDPPKKRSIQGDAHRYSTSSLVRFSNSVFEHFVRRYRMLILQLFRTLDSSRWDAVLELFSGPWDLSTGQGIWKGEIFRHQAQLDQHGCLIPRDMFMV